MAVVDVRERDTRGSPGEATNAVDTEGETPPKADENARGTRPPRPGFVVVHPRPLDDALPQIPVRGRMCIGRGSGSDIELPDAKVSRRHADLEPCPGGFWVSDRGSRNGTFVNGVPVHGSAVKAEHGSLVRIANTLLMPVEDVEFCAGKPRRFLAQDVGTSRDMIAGPVLAKVWDTAATIGQSDHPVLVLGESGSGKELIARLIHGARPEGGPFVALNLAAIPEGLFESELFGHERGAFTGAATRRAGAFREADQGVLFLDEVGELRPDLQVKLLRALDTRRIRALGSSAEVRVQVRVVSATNRDLREAVSRGAFREDLYYRLASIELVVPPLRTRKDDILLLAVTMLRDEAPGLRLSTDAAEILALAPWPGNVRNLRRAIAAAVTNATRAGRSTVDAPDLPNLTPIDFGQVPPHGLTVDRLRTALVRAGGVVQRAARELGIARSSFYNECKRLGVNPTELRRRP